MTEKSLGEGALLWQPSDALLRNCALRAYIDWLGQNKGLRFEGYPDLWQWSVEQIDDFWESIWQFFEVQASQPYSRPLAAREMPGARWFADARLNYAEHVFRMADDGRPAILFAAEQQPLAALSWAELRRQVAAFADQLRAWGVGPGDRVVAYLPNIPEAAVAFLACASIGAIWSSCSSDMGQGSVIDRFRQIAPRVLIAADGYRYGGKAFDRREQIAQLQAALPGLEHTVLVAFLDPRADAAALQGGVLWSEIMRAVPASQSHELSFEQVPFDHPLWVLYSSGTTGLPKAIVQGQGGILLEHLKSLRLQLDIGPGDRFFWFTTTGWMMWNFLLGGLLVGATIVLYDGSPGYPEPGTLWALAAEAKVSFFGTSAAYIGACMKQGVAPARDYPLAQLRAVGSTGSPLPGDGFGWIYEQVGRDIWLASISGGSDVCTAFVGGSPLLPVRAGEIQCRALGAAVAAYDEAGRPLIDKVGELVVTAPMPSMPLFFWGDEGNRRYRESYFAHYPGVWRHGDWVKITQHGGVVISGRSDSTINRQGVRMGTSEIYRAVEALPEVLDSLVIDLEGLGADGAVRPSWMALFVVLRAGLTLDAVLAGAIKRHIRTTLSPRHVPDEIVQIAEVPRTLNGKKLEVPVKKILLGAAPAQVASHDSLANPQALGYFEALAGRFAQATPTDA